jgi:hypothetical protein
LATSLFLGLLHVMRVHARHRHPKNPGVVVHVCWGNKRSRLEKRVKTKAPSLRNKGFYLHRGSFIQHSAQN